MEEVSQGFGKTRKKTKVPKESERLGKRQRFPRIRKDEEKDKDSQGFGKTRKRQRFPRIRKDETK
jgi:hypothetical protein